MRVLQLLMLGVIPPFGQDILQVLRNLRIKLHPLPCFGMFKAQRFGMLGLSRNDLETIIDKLLVLTKGYPF